MDPNTHVHGPAPGHDHACTIIFLHGRDSTAQELASELFESEASPNTATTDDQDLTLPGLLPSARWVFPSAPILRSQRFDIDMSQWFDMWYVEDPEEQPDIQRSGLDQSMQTLRAVIEAEEKLITRDSMFVCGVSQGFATVVSQLIGGNEGGFAGLIGLCSWLPFAVEVEMMAPPAKLKSTPIFLGHALDDEVVPIKNGQRMRNVLSQNLELRVEWNVYEDGGHWINEPQGVDDIVSFIKANLKQ
ncbi:Phospholipase/carboxylesterase [Cordyceps fumosorosea ARSEF 2679]|uniref:Phospholipase/carboxylesterase n=1 Tax=Cordyceps fumosorosea (strain ARSEF 2679) TaxID=1081104 RepID=A0A167YG66_CORFA|nr:Phospholipase/carboxylesterase [Cordyceps fumosorosea ARSEF 2679]OAA66285.1 Phospholipase/carboxylesterase [Cordyceps fumosorosea ARSEF 2679]